MSPAGGSRFIWFDPWTFQQLPQGPASVLNENRGNYSRRDNRIYGFVYTDLNGRQTDLWHVLNNKCEPIPDSKKEANPKKTKTPKGGAPYITPRKNLVDEDGYSILASTMDTRVEDLPARNEKFHRSLRNDYTQLLSLDDPHTPRGRVDDVDIRRGEEGDLSVSSDEQFRGQRNPYYPSPPRKEWNGPYIESVKEGKLVNEAGPAGPPGIKREATELPEDGLPQTGKQLSASRSYDIQMDSPRVHCD